MYDESLGKVTDRLPNVVFRPIAVLLDPIEKKLVQGRSMGSNVVYTRFRGGASVFSSNGTLNYELYVGGGYIPLRLVACEASWRVASVPELLAGDWAILSRDICSMLLPILIVTVVSPTEAPHTLLQKWAKACSSVPYVGCVRDE